MDGVSLSCHADEGSQFPATFGAPDGEVGKRWRGWAEEAGEGEEQGGSEGGREGGKRATRVTDGEP